MDNMMSITGWNTVFIVLWSLHITAVIASFVGVLFLIILAIKTFSPTQLKKWGIGLIIFGSVLCLITIGIIGRPWIGFSYGKMGMEGRMMERGMMMERMMDEMTEHDETSNDAGHEEHKGMMEMMRMMMGKGMMGASGIDDLTDSDSSSAILDEHHESSSSLSL